MTVKYIMNKLAKLRYNAVILQWNQLTAQLQNFCNVLHSTMHTELDKTLFCSLANSHTAKEDWSLLINHINVIANSAYFKNISIKDV